MYPGDEFLPKAPEPEEIIIGDEDATEGNVNLGALADLVEQEKEKQTETENHVEHENPVDSQPSETITSENAVD